MENTETMLDETIQGVEDVNNAEAEQEDAATTPQGAEETNDAEAKTSQDTFLIRYNHEDKELTRDEVVQYAQKGHKYDALAPTLDKLSFLASIQGKGATEWLEEQIKNAEENYRQELADKYDDEEVINLFMERYKAENEAKYNKYKSDKADADTQAEKKAMETLEGRIATEFLELQGEFPEYTDVTQIPADVLKLVKKGTNLTDAVLRYKHQEQKRINLAKQTAKSNADASTGKMSGDAEQHDSIMEAFFKGLR